MENKESKKEMSNFFLKGSDNTTNNAVKALLLGFIVGLFFMLLGRDFDFDKPSAISHGVIATIIVAGGLFLKYNNKK